MQVPRVATTTIPARSKRLNLRLQPADVMLLYKTNEWPKKSATARVPSPHAKQRSDYCPEPMDGLPNRDASIGTLIFTSVSW
jgi:hypothetical protein